MMPTPVLPSHGVTRIWGRLGMGRVGSLTGKPPEALFPVGSAPGHDHWPDTRLQWPAMMGIYAVSHPREVTPKEGRGGEGRPLALFWQSSVD